MWQWGAAAVVFWSVAVLFHSTLHPDPPVRSAPVAEAPTHVARSHLQLWLTADRGVRCDNGTGTIATWTDLSGHHRNATSGAHKGPACHATLHALAGVDLPYFSAPGDRPPYIDGTLDLDLGFLAHTDFTIFVVERRWADGSRVDRPNQELIGTDFNRDPRQCPEAGYQITLGYAYYDGIPTLNYESNCYRPWSGTRGPVPPTPALPPGPLAIDMLRLAQSHASSPTVWQNGVRINVGGASGGAGADFTGRSIGRAFESRSDNRFRGDIAEIVIFDAALGDVEAHAMEAYFREHWRL